MEVMRYPSSFIDLDAASYKKPMGFIEVEDIFLDFCNDEQLLNMDNEGSATCKSPKVEEGLAVPEGDIAEVGWLSNFIEGSSSIEDDSTRLDEAFKTTRVDEFSSKPVGITAGDTDEGSPASGLESSTTSQLPAAAFPDISASGSALPGRARSKRSRAGTPNRKPWTADIQLLDKNVVSPCSSNDDRDYDVGLDGEDDDEGDISSMLDDTSTTTTTPRQHCSSTSFTAESNLRRMVAPPPRKRAKTRKNKQQMDAKVDAGVMVIPGGGNTLGLGLGGEGHHQTQKCLHCGSEKTPQWRTGPLGPKTLCNACGVRFKSGRLFPEYRPAASPSFVPQKHSNSHKRVLEMRKQKETVVVEINPRQQVDDRDDEQCHFRQHRVPRRREINVNVGSSSGGAAPATTAAAGYEKYDPNDIC